MNYFDFADIILDKVNIDNIPYRTISLPSKSIPLDKSKLQTTVVGTGEIYRSDKIAFRIYGRTDLFWLLDYANNFNHGFKEYALGAKIFYISPNDLPLELQ